MYSVFEESQKQFKRTSREKTEKDKSPEYFKIFEKNHNIAKIFLVHIFFYFTFLISTSRSEIFYNV